MSNSNANSGMEGVQFSQFLLEAVHLQLLLLSEAHLDEEVTDVVPLVSLQLDHLPILRVLHNSAIAGKLLRRR